MSVWFSIIMIRLVESLRKVYVFSFMPVLLFFLTLLDLEKQKQVSVVGLLSVSLSLFSLHFKSWNPKI